MYEIAFQPNQRNAGPLYRQLVEYLSELIATGRLSPGEQLPPTRRMASALGISRNTVAQSYDSLVAAGLADSTVGRGTFVTHRSPGSPASEDDLTSDDSANSGSFAWGGLLSLRSRSFRLPPRRPSLRGPEVKYDFRPGGVDPESIPVQALVKAYTRVTQSGLKEGANERSLLGWPVLREEIARSLVARGIWCSAEDVLITSGAQQALDLIARVLLDPGDSIVMEQPGYFAAAVAFKGAEANVIGVDVDDEGMRIDELERIARSRRVKMIYTMPAVHMPTGVSLSPDRRQGLLDLADGRQIPIIEDDYDAELHLRGTSLPALKTRDSNGQVIYVGTFSKVLHPGVRLGFIVAPRPLLGVLAEARLASSMQPSFIDQAGVAELLASGSLDGHVRRIRRLYDARMNAMLEALETEFPEGTTWCKPVGGTSVWVRLPDHIDFDKAMGRAAEGCVALTGREFFYLEPTQVNGLALSFAIMEPVAIREGIAALGAILKV